MSWTELTSKPGASEQPGLVADNSGGLLYAFGGIGGSGRTTEAHVYDPDTDAWSAIASMNVARGDNPGGFELGGLIYAFGGSDTPGQSAVATAERYNPATDTWSNIASMPRARALKGVGAVSGGVGYAIGGRNFDGSASVAQADRWTPGTATWDTPTSMPGGARMGIAAAGGQLTDTSGRIYLVGGVTIENPSTAGTKLKRLERYTPGTGWETLADLPATRRYAAAGVIGDVLHLVAGLGETGSGTDYDTPQGDLLIYNPSTDSWRDPSDPLPVQGQAQGAVLDGKLYVLAGSRLFRWDPANGWWAGRVAFG